MPKGVPSETCGDYGGSRNNGEPCGRASGWGTPNDSGRCRKCLGTSPDGSSHKDNQNAQKHALFSKRDGYYQNLSDTEQDWIFNFTNDLLDRKRRMKGGDPDMFDKEALKNIAIDFHRVATANSWFADKGLTQPDMKVTPQGGTVEVGEKINQWAAEIRQYNESIYRRMQKHGLLEDPESEKAQAIGDATALWMEELSE